MLYSHYPQVGMLTDAAANTSVLPSPPPWMATQLVPVVQRHLAHDLTHPRPFSDSGSWPPLLSENVVSPYPHASGNSSLIRNRFANRVGRIRCAPLANAGRMAKETLHQRRPAMVAWPGGRVRVTGPRKPGSSWRCTCSDRPETLRCWSWSPSRRLVCYQSWRNRRRC